MKKLSLSEQAALYASKNETGWSEVHQEVHTQAELTPPVTEWSGRHATSEWCIYHGPAKETLRLLRKESIDCTITSPPYYWLRDYKVQGQIGLEDSVDGYVVALTDVMNEVYRVLRSDGLLFLNLGDTYYSGKGESQGVDKKSAKRRFGLRAVDKSGGLGIGLQRKSLIGVPWRVAMKMCQQNWILRSAVIWHRVSCLPEPVRDRPRRGYEFVFIFAKSRHYYFYREGLPRNGASEDVWSIPARPKANGGSDTAPYPDELVEQCLAIGCRPGGSVLDPFCGSGTTMRVALDKGYKAIGIELSEDFCKAIVKTLERKVPQ